MASKTHSSSLVSEIKEVVTYKLDDGASSACDEKAADGQDSFIEESWNNPPVNKYRFGSCLALFLSGGLLFASYGVLIPQYEKDRHISHATVSQIFIGDVVASTVAATTGNLAHLSLGRRGAGAIGALFLGLGNLLLTLHPPWPAVPVMICVAAYGVAALESIACSWTGSLRHASGLLGILQGFFGIGCTISPLIANALIQHGIPYYRFYYVPSALAIVGGIVFIISFWDETGKKYVQDTSGSHKGGAGHAKEILRSKVSWILALLVTVNWGIEATLGSWMVVFLTDARNGSSSHAGLVNSMYWFSFTLGRFVLTWVIGVLPPKWQGKGPISFLLALSIILEFMAWRLPTFVGSSVTLCLLGFCSGPFYPMILRMLTKLLPRHLHVSAIGIGTALGSGGNSGFPIAAGLIAGSKGISMIHPLVLSSFIAGLILWNLIPTPSEQPITEE